MRLGLCGATNSDAYLKSLSGKRRGCIISQIAEQHAKYSMYGPKGGAVRQRRHQGRRRQLRIKL